MKLKTLSLLLIALVFSWYLQGQNYSFGKVSKEELQLEAHLLEPETNAAVIYREMNTKFLQSESKGFYTETNVFERIKIFNKEGFDYATKYIKLYRGNSNSSSDRLIGLKATIFSLNEGKIEKKKLQKSDVFKERLSDFVSVEKFTMPNVKPGDVIDIKYTLSSTFITDLDEYKLQGKIPVDNYKMSFAAPEYFVYKIHQKGFMPFKVNTSERNRSMRYSFAENASTGGLNGGGSSGRSQSQEVEFKENVYTINKTNIPSMKNEPLAGNIDNYLAGLKLELSYTNFPNSPVSYYSTSWDDVSKTIYQSENFGGELNNTGFLKNEMPKILGDATTEQEKIVAVYEFVKNNTTWDNYTGIFAREGIKQTYKNGKGNSGDINLLLVAILREAGINANPILVSTVSNGVSILPTQNGFNFVIGGVEVENNVILLDATSDNAPNVLDERLLNWQGRLIRKDGSSNWIGLIPSKPAMRNTIVKYSINGDQEVSGTMQKRFTGNLAANFRERYNGLTSDATRKKLEENIGDCELSEIEVENLDNVYKPVQYKSDFENDTAVEEIGDKLYLTPLLFLASEENIFKADKRELPVYFNYPRQDRMLITIDVPEGYAVESMPDSVNIALGDNQGAYKFIISEMGNKIQLSVDNLIKEPVFLQKDYNNIKEFFEAIVKKENEKIVLTKV